MKLPGSNYKDPAIRATMLGEQFREAIWREHQGGYVAPLGVVLVDLQPWGGAAAGSGASDLVYLCGGIAGLPDAAARGWRDAAAQALAGSYRCLDPMRRDYRGREAENTSAIVEGDLNDIQAAGVVLVNASRPSWGTAMEVFAAASMGRYVAAFGAGENPSPWLAYHCNHLAENLTAAVLHLQARVHACRAE